MGKTSGSGPATNFVEFCPWIRPSKITLDFSGTTTLVHSAPDPKIFQPGDPDL